MSESFLYNRRAKLLVGVADDPKQPSGFKEGTEIKIFENLRMQFTIEKGSKSEANQARIVVFNLSGASRSFFETTPLYFILQAGYEFPGQDPFVENIFQGSIIAITDPNTGKPTKSGKVANVRNGADWQTSVEFGDGQSNQMTAKINKSFQQGITLKTAIQDVAGTFKLPINEIRDVPDKTFESGLVLSGTSKDELDKLAETAGVEASIQDGEIQILAPKSTTSDEAIVLTENTGLLGSPIRRAEGLELLTLLIPRIRPGRKLSVASNEIEGVFRCRKVIFEGDTHEGNWNARVEAI